MRRAAANLGTVLTTGLIATGCGGGHKPADHTGGSSTPAAPGPIIGGPGSSASPLSSADQRAATSAARDFLRGYLPYLYGRTRAQTVRPVSPTVARTLRASHGRVTPAQRRRTPRATELTVTGQTAAARSPRPPSPTADPRPTTSPSRWSAAAARGWCQRSATTNPSDRSACAPALAPGPRCSPRSC